MLKEVVDAAETMDTGRIHKDALAAIEVLKIRGPGSNRKVAWWGQVGETTLAAGCLTAALVGTVVLGIPCVVGGAVSSAAIRYWATGSVSQ